MALSTDFMPFIFGGNTGETLESIARKRQVAEALLARGGTPKNVGEGLTAVGNALASVILERRAAAGEKAGQEGAGADFSSLTALRKSLGLDDEGGGDVTGATPSVAPGVAPPTPAWSPRNPPPATENVPVGWGGGGNFAPPAGAGAPTVGAAAPSVGAASPTGFSGGKQAFIDMLMPAALELSKKTGLDPGLIIGQAALESGWGRHAPGGNYFGVKSHGMPGGQTLRTTEYAGGQPHAENASFRTYSGPEASVRGYGDFLQQNPRYGPMLKAQGLDAQLAALAKSGYATDPNYVYGPIDPATGRPRDPNAGVAGIARRISVPQGGTQVASLDPSIGLPPAPTAVQNVAGALPGGGPPAPSPGVAMVASALQGGGGAPAGPEMASAAPFPMGGASGLAPPFAPPFVPPSVPTGIQSGRPPPMMPTQALSPSAPPPRPAAAPPPAMGGGISEAARQKALEVLNHPFSNAVQKAQALEVLKMAQQQRDPAYQLKLQTERAQLDQILNPKPSAADTLAREKFDWEKAHPPAGSRPMTADEATFWKVKPDQAGFMDEKGTPHILSTGGTNVDVKVNTQSDELFAGLPKDVRDELFKRQTVATDAADLLRITNDGRQILDAGVITGAGADLKVAAVKWLNTFGFPISQDQANNSETFKAVMGQAVGKIIKQFGAGTGLSDADREYARQISGGDIALNEPALRHIFEIADKAARAQIANYSKMRDKVLGGDLSAILGVEEPPAYVAPVAPPPPVNIPKPLAPGTYELDPATNTLRLVQ